MNNFFTKRVVKHWNKLLKEVWRDLKVVQMWHLGTWHSGGLCSKCLVNGGT